MHCNFCGLNGDQSLFYISNKTKCKDCIKKSALKHRIENIERIRVYDRRRASQPHRMAQNESISKAYKENFPGRAKATNAVNNAVRDGRLQKWPCEVCGNPRSVGHHTNYDSPLGVTWLCQPHHKQAHALTDNLIARLERTEK